MSSKLLPNGQPKPPTWSIIVAVFLMVGIPILLCAGIIQLFSSKPQQSAAAVSSTPQVTQEAKLVVSVNTATPIPATSTLTIVPATSTPVVPIISPDELTKTAKAETTVLAFAKYKTNAPSGTFAGFGTRVKISTDVSYATSETDSGVSVGSKWIFFDLLICNSNAQEFNISPNYADLVSIDRRLARYAPETYGFSNHLPVDKVAENKCAKGRIVFITDVDFVPGFLVWDNMQQKFAIPILTNP